MSNHLPDPHGDGATDPGRHPDPSPGEPATANWMSEELELLLARLLLRIVLEERED